MNVLGGKDLFGRPFEFHNLGAQVVFWVWGNIQLRDKLPFWLLLERLMSGIKSTGDTIEFIGGVG